MGLRWRTQKEVVSGRGQFICGAKVRVLGLRVGAGGQCGAVLRCSAVRRSALERP